MATIAAGVELTFTADPRDRAATAVLHILAAEHFDGLLHLDWVEGGIPRVVVAHTYTTTVPLTGGLAWAWRACESILGRGVLIDLWDGAMRLDHDLRARVVHAIATAYSVDVEVTI